MENYCGLVHEGNLNHRARYQLLHDFFDIRCWVRVSVFSWWISTIFRWLWPCNRFSVQPALCIDVEAPDLSDKYRVSHWFEITDWPRRTCLKACSWRWTRRTLAQACDASFRRWRGDGCRSRYNGDRNRGCFDCRAFCSSSNRIGLAFRRMPF